MRKLILSLFLLWHIDQCYTMDQVDNISAKIASSKNIVSVVARPGGYMGGPVAIITWCEKVTEKKK